MSGIINLSQVSLWRRTQEEFSYDFKKTILSILEGKYHKPKKNLVLDKITLEINAGDKIGIIGANGSGKSTLLKIICGILQPTTGKVRVKGSIAPIIELSAGFEKELSVLDNIVLYGVLLGFTRKEIKARVSSILQFAELEDYALAPVKALSSGMIAKLGFSIATSVNPDILILDEILSVGDESFKQKYKQRMGKFWNQNVTVLVVSHDLDVIQNSCARVIWLDRGQVKFVGDPKEAVDAYLREKVLVH